MNSRLWRINSNWHIPVGRNLGCHDYRESKGIWGIAMFVHFHTQTKQLCRAWFNQPSVNCTTEFRQTEYTWKMNVSTGLQRIVTMPLNRITWIFTCTIWYGIYALVIIYPGAHIVLLIPASITFHSRGLKKTACTRLAGLVGLPIKVK